MNKLYNELKEILLSKDEKYSFLVKHCEDQRVNYLKYNISAESIQQIDLYLNGLNNFFNSYVGDLVEYQNLIAYNYFKYLNIFYEYVNMDNYSANYLEEYRKSVIRTMELALFLQSKNLEINKLFFSTNQKIFYLNLLDIYHIDFDKTDLGIAENQETLLIDSQIKIQSDGIFVGLENSRYKYISTVKRAAGYSRSATLFLYLRLREKSVNNVYLCNELREKIGESSGNFIKLIPLDLYPKQLYSHNKIVYYGNANKEVINVVDFTPKTKKKYDRFGSLYDNDEEYESIAKSTKRLLNTEDELYSIKDSEKEYNNYINDDHFKLKTQLSDDKNIYKKHKLNMAIGHLQAKSNLNLSSKYSIPKIEVLTDFIKFIQISINSTSQFEYQLLVISIVLGLDYKRVIGMLLKISADVDIVQKKYIKVSLTTAYAEIHNFDIFEKSAKYVEIEIPNFLINLIEQMKILLFQKLEILILEYKTLWGEDVNNEFQSCKSLNQLKQFISNNLDPKIATQIFDTLMIELQTDLAKFLSKYRKLFKKTIVVNTRNLHLYSHYYFKLFHKESDINSLFLKNKTANIHTKLAYVSTIKKLSNMTVWINELLERLQITDSSNQAITISTKYAGSDKVISSKVFKTFLKILMELEMKNHFSNLSVRMIYLRYIFSVLFVSRKFYFSVNLKQYSSREKLLFIHEKEKNIYTAKRIIPVTELGDRYIQYFLKLKKNYNIQSYSPAIILNDGSILDFNNENLKYWFSQNKEEISSILSEQDYKLFENFILSVVLDFGRHIFATKVHNDMKLEQDYIDALLNHFEKGTQDQGMYSLFDNKKYFAKSREILEIIEKEYIPFCKYLQDEV